ncbi:MAG: M6 family metalloprotease domain-containing protein [Candidatus Marinimicrobia bacterium]|nr:M6 family metalloprotease domain-containing protein [Candidatus Neomarinimicrobiota bacterium]MCF7841184.1 M6 family metalloprotease domain-containing protein [Candidatus Neomarinimicrobiota bacterium]
MSPAKPGVVPSPKVIAYQQQFAQTYQLGGLAAAIQRVKAAKLSTSRDTQADTLYMSFPVIVGNYADAGEPAYPIENLQHELFDGPWPTTTMREHYLEMSYNQFHLSGHVYGWYPVAHGHAYYEGHQTEPYDNGFVSPPGGVGSFLKETLLAADSTVDFAQYDNDGPDGIPNSGDDDGTVDACFFVHSGRGGEGGGPSIWSHRSRYSSWWGSAFVTNDSSANGSFIRINDYIIQPAMSASSGMIEIGVFSHEFGHAIGLPDLYDTDYSSDGIGNWGLMSGGSWNTPTQPAHLSAWCKEVLGWLTPVLVTDNLDSVAIPSVEDHPYALKLWRNGQPDPWTSWYGLGLDVGREYYLIENRQRIGTDVHLVGTGLLIWHIDNSQYGNSNESHRLVDMAAADGTFGNGTSPGDPWPGNTDNRNFDFETIPAAIGWDGTNTQVAVLNISDSDTTMYANVEVHETIPHLAVTTYDVYDQTGDDIMEPGESFEVWIHVRNTGGFATGVQTSISSTSPDVIVTSASADIPNLDFMDTGIGNVPFELLVDDSAQTSVVELNIQLTAIETADTARYSIFVGIGSPEVGLVDNDGNTGTSGDVREFYQKALDSLQVVFKVWDVASQGQPDSSWFATKPIVIWFTGNIHSPLTSQSTSELATYLDNGGRLLLTGQHVGDSYVQFPDFFQEYLGAQVTDFDVHEDYVFARPDEAGFTSHDRFLLTAADGAHNQSGTDMVDPYNNGLSLFYYPFIQSNAGVYQSNSMYRSIYLGFGLEAISNTLAEGTQTRRELLNTLLSWLRMPTTDTHSETIPFAQDYQLSTVFPNPFNPSVSIKLDQVAGSSGEIHIYDISGREVAQFSIGKGQQIVTWTPDRRVASGLYFAQLWRAQQPVGSILKMTYLK